MFPWIRSGDLVFVGKFALRASVARRRGFVRTRRGGYFVHRVIRDARGAADGRESGWSVKQYTDYKGDALDREDKPVSREEFLGRVIRVHRGNHHIDMGSMGRMILGRLIARFSRASFALYHPLAS